MSKDVLGVEVVESPANIEFDFRLARGKYPRDLWGVLRISIGSGKEGIETQQSCLNPCSSTFDAVRENAD